MKEKICGIYCVENKINGHKYVGLSKDCMKRWSRNEPCLTCKKALVPSSCEEWDKSLESSPAVPPKLIT